MGNDYICTVKKFIKELIGFRRDFHQHPELGFNERRSAGIISAELAHLGYQVRSGIAETGVVGVIGSGKPVVMLRFDMDALPVIEESAHEYASKNTGIMHACGHDGHMAVGVMTARLLAKEYKNPSGTIKFVFQPAEEGLGGAAKMIEAGVLEDPQVDYCLGMHIWNDRPLGWVGITPGPVMAGSDYFQIKIHGVGGHGAIPHQSKDVIIASSMIIQALQTIISRNIAPLQPGVVSVTSINAGTAFNVIPAEATLLGTIRYFSEEVHRMLIERVQEIVHGIASALGCRAEIDITDITPALNNQPDLTRKISGIVHGMSLFDQVDSQFQTMGSEDMALFQKRISGCYLFFGSANESKGYVYGHHHPRFDFDEDVLPLCVATMTACASGLLEK